MRWFSAASIKASSAVGSGVFLALGVLQWGEVKLPTWGFVLGLVVAGCMITYGLIGMVVSRAAGRAARAGGVPVDRDKKASAEEGDAGDIDVRMGDKALRITGGELEDLEGDDIRHSINPDGSTRTHIGRLFLGRVGPGKERPKE